MGKVIALNSRKNLKRKEICNICREELVDDTCLKCDPIPDFKEYTERKLVNVNGKTVQIIPTLNVCPMCKNPYCGDICPVCE